MSVNTYNSTTGVLTRVAGNGGGSFIYPHISITAETGSTVTITDGTATITAIETSEGLFEADVVNLNIYTITATLEGVVLTRTLDVDTVKKYSVDFESSVSVTLTIYSAKEDTISYTDIDGDTQTITFDTDATSKQVSIDIEVSGSAITFTSGVAKDPSNLSNYYSKTVTITSNTTEVYLMPDNALYWWGYEDSDLEDISNANGWVHNSRSFGTPTRNTNDIQLTCNTTNVVGIACKNQISPTSAHVITNSVTGGTAFCFDASKNMISTTTYKNVTVSGSSLTKTDMTSISNSGYLYIRTATNNYSAKVNALWYE